MINGRDKFCYGYGFMDCFMMMSGDTAKLREKHAWMAEELWKAFLPLESTQSIQTLINALNHEGIWKMITKTMQGKMMSDVLNKSLKDKMSSY